MAGRSRRALVEQLEAGVRLLVEQRTLSIRGVARVIGLSRNTVRRIVRGEWTPRAPRPGRPRRMPTAHVDRIVALAEDRPMSGSGRSPPCWLGAPTETRPPRPTRTPRSAGTALRGSRRSGPSRCGWKRGSPLLLADGRDPAHGRGAHARGEAPDRGGEPPSAPRRRPRAGPDPEGRTRDHPRGLDADLLPPGAVDREVERAGSTGSAGPRRDARGARCSRDEGGPKERTCSNEHLRSTGRSTSTGSPKMPNASSINAFDTVPASSTRISGDRGGPRPRAVGPRRRSAQH